MFAFEWVSLVFFFWLTLVGLSRGSATGAFAAAAMSATVVAAPLLLPIGARQWLAHVYLALGYWIPAWMTTNAPSQRFEAWLARGDARFGGMLGLIPRGIVALGEVAYLLCLPLVPLSFLVVWSIGVATDVDRYWVAVLLAGFACYGTLPWLVSRPPRVLDPRPARSGAFARSNTWVLARVSHGRNTFPSGHVAVATAAAVAVSWVSPVGGAMVGVVAAGVAIGAAMGRYHFVVDVLIGTGVGLGCALAAWMMR